MLITVTLTTLNTETLYRETGLIAACKTAFPTRMSLPHIAAAMSQGQTESCSTFLARLTAAKRNNGGCTTRGLWGPSERRFSGTYETGNRRQSKKKLYLMENSIPADHTRIRSTCRRSAKWQRNRPKEARWRSADQVPSHDVLKAQDKAEVVPEVRMVPMVHVSAPKIREDTHGEIQPWHIVCLSLSGLWCHPVSHPWNRNSSRLHTQRSTQAPCYMQTVHRTAHVSDGPDESFEKTWYKESQEVERLCLRILYTDSYNNKSWGVLLKIWL